MKDIFIESHKKTREFKEKYNIDYQLQFGLFVRDLYKNNQVELIGTKRLVSWANQIRSEMLSKISDSGVVNKLNNIQDSQFFIDNRDLDIESLILNVNNLQ